MAMETPTLKTFGSAVGSQELALGPGKSERGVVGDPQHLDAVAQLLGSSAVANIFQAWNMEPLVQSL